VSIRVTPAAAALMLALGSIAVAPISPALAQTVGTEAAIQTTTFTVENMTCATCPITVRLAMESVEGVRSAEVDFQTGSATVFFDRAETDPEAIAAASTNAGYPAAPAGGTAEEGH
jgi:mercuric ion binding protein